MREPSLQCGAKAPTYRFTWLRTFHHPLVVRVTRDGGAIRVVAIELDGAGGYGPGKILRHITRSVAPGKWTEFQRSVEQLTISKTDERRGADGSEWIFEFRTDADYRAIQVWRPESGPARTLGELFLSLAGIVVPTGERY